jgi:hypothetical protein
MVFFKSLVVFEDKDELNSHRSRLLIEITHLLCSINSNKLLETILREFLNRYPSIFVFDEMFLLLLTEYYHEDGHDIELQTNQLNIICTMICEFNLFLREKSHFKPEVREKEEASYNKNVLTNCKEILFEKMRKHPSISYLYLRLFSLLFRPIDASVYNFLGFVYERVMDVVKSEQFITLADDNLILMQKIINCCVAICEFVFNDALKLEQLIANFGVREIVGKEHFADIDIIKIAALTSKFEISELVA